MSVVPPRGPRAATTIGVTSGKGGVGKTAIAINLAVALAGAGARVGVLDADFALGKIDVMLGLTPRQHLGHVVHGACTLDEVVIDGPGGIAVMPSGSGHRELTALTPDHWLRLASEVDRIRDRFDYLILDTAAGISDNVVDLAAACQRVLVVTSPDPGAMVDGYAVAKLISLQSPDADLGLVVNLAGTTEEANLVFRQLDLAADRFLNRRLSYFGCIPRDPALGESVRAQQALVARLPHSPAGRAFRRLASRVSGLGPVPGRSLRMPARTLALAHSRKEEVPQCA
ncbi:MAG: P-loop NTPase [Vicinamibacterales bacterium]|nr:P-loop NTPase [Vicinamibacterales bacterium]